MTSLRVAFPALGTTASVVVQRASDLVPARRALEAELERIDLACSRFRDDSEISRLHRAGGAPVVVGDALYEAVVAALSAAEVTDGLVDPTVGADMVALGYDRDFALLDAAPDVPLPGAPVAPAPRRGRQARRRRPGWREVRLDPAGPSVQVPPGVLLDLGATAKALAVDRAARAAWAVCEAGVLVNVGGDIAVAGPPPEGGWPVAIADRHDDEDPSNPCVAVHDGALATSSTVARRWRHHGQVCHHIIDPATGTPAAEHWRTVSVCAATCVGANTASTASFLLGELAPQWLAELGLPARLVAATGAVVHVAGWPASPDQAHGAAA